MARTRSAQVGVTTNDAERTYDAEDAFELEMPTRELSLDEANKWLAMIAEAEDIDQPIVLRANLSRQTEALALTEDWCIAVRDSKPTQLLLLHELAHLLCANKNHGVEFRTELIRLVRRYISLPHAVCLHNRFISNMSTVLPFTATAK